MVGKILFQENSEIAPEITSISIATYMQISLKLREVNFCFSPTYFIVGLFQLTDLFISTITENLFMFSAVFKYEQKLIQKYDYRRV